MGGFYYFFMNKLNLVTFKKYVDSFSFNNEMGIHIVSLLDQPSLTVQVMVYERMLKRCREEDIIDILITKEKGWSWTEDFQDWFVKRDRDNIFKIPEDKISSNILKKYSYLFSMKKAGIL